MTAEIVDDKSVLALHSNLKISSNLIQHHLDLLETLYNGWGVKANQFKSKHCTFLLSNKDCLPVYVNDIPLFSVKNVQYLGLHLDSYLTWATHITNKWTTPNNRFRELRLLLSSNRLNLNNKILIYKYYLNSFGPTRANSEAQPIFSM